MNLVVKEENDFFEDLMSTRIWWLPNLEDMHSDEDPFQLTIKDRHVIRIVFMDSQIPRMPDSIANLTHLEEVELQNNWFEEFPVEIFTIPNLKKLVSRNNRYREIKFGNCLSLQKLTVDDKIPFLPESIGNLSNLTDLDLSNNRQSILPESIGNLSNLTDLDLSNNRLQFLPSSIVNLKKLKNLDLRSNCLTTLPEAIGQLTSLKELEIWNNKITSLPDSLGDCSFLKVIKAQMNELSTVPATLSNLKELRVLDVSDNHITNIPEELAQLKNLKLINFS